MARYVSDKRFKADMAELEAYRSTGLTPKEMLRMMTYQNEEAPLPLTMDAPLDEDDRVASGLLEED